MSQPGPFGPFAPQTPKPAATPVAMAPAGSVRMEYLRSYNYIFENPNWTSNIMWGFLCIISTALIPVVGQLVFMGYQFEVIESLILARGARYVDFDINKFGDYIGRSIWPFLVALIVAIPLVIVIYAGLFGVFLAAAAGAAIGGEDFGPVLAILFGVLGFVLLMVLSAFAGALLTPMILRAGLQQDFAAGFDFGWAMDFLKKTWVELILSLLFIQFSGLVLMMLGALAFCIGMYAAMAVMMLAQSHLWYQLYMLYLSRGGRPVPLKPQMPMMPQPGYIPPPQY